MNDRAVLLMSTCGCILIGGAFGGFVGAWYRKITNSSPCPENKKDYAFFACTGIISAFGIMFLCITAGKLFNQPDLVDSCTFAIGVSLISGYFSMRLLPKLGNKIENELNLLQKKIEETEENTKSAISYNQLISMAEMALTEKKPSELKAAIEAMSEVVDMYPRDRMFNIYYGRLLRWSGDERKAILTLRNYIAEVRKVGDDNLTAIDKSGMATAYYNIACYHILLASKIKGERSRLLKEAGEALRSAVLYQPEFKDECSTDKDFIDLLKTDPDFVKNAIAPRG